MKTIRKSENLILHFDFYDSQCLTSHSAAHQNNATQNEH